MSLENNITETSSSVNYWYKNASIRMTPRRILHEIIEGEKIFPIARQPLAIHPNIIDLGEKWVDFILIQTAYRYMYEIATLETETVNAAALKIATNKFHFAFNKNQCMQAMTIIIDEAYHAYVALDFIQQTQEITKIEPIFLPQDNAVKRVLVGLQNTELHKFYNLLELVTVCLSEHVLTKDLVYFKRESGGNNFFNSVMQDHLSDEGRHAGYFANILKYLWGCVNEEEKMAIAHYIPILINGYIDSSAQKEYEKKLLIHIGLSDTKAEETLYDTYFEKDKNLDPNVKNFINVLLKSKLLDNNSVKDRLLLSGFNV